MCPKMKNMLHGREANNSLELFWVLLMTFQQKRINSKSRQYQGKQAQVKSEGKK